VAILGGQRNGPLAHWLAAAGARVMASVGTTTTMLVVGNDQPFGHFFSASPAHRRAEELRGQGHAIEIIAEEDLRARMGLPLAS
jgi:DNA polymerase-3 subunit epsilon